MPPTEYLAGSTLTPPLAPPNGTSTIAHLKVMRAASAHTSSSVTSSLYLIPTQPHHMVLMTNERRLAVPPLQGVRW